jgi:type IV secretion system protein VirB9
MRKLWKLAALAVFMTMTGMTTPAGAALPSRESSTEEILEYLKEQYPHIEIPESADVIWVESTGKGAEADIEEALKRGAILPHTRVSDPNAATMGAAEKSMAAGGIKRYPQAPDPFQVAMDFDDGYDDENFDTGEPEMREMRGERDIRLSKHWLDIREDLSLREIDRKALDLVEDFSQAKHALPPVSMQAQNGALSYSYGDHIPRILCRPNHLTDIALQAGEKVTAVHAGDTARWQIAPAVSGAGGEETVHVVVKPLMPDIRTNLLVMTDRRTYNLDLLSSANDFIPGVRFSYPGDVLNSWNTFIAENKKKKEDETLLANAYNLSPDDLYFGYEITKGKELPWRPVRVFDDGVKTYIEMPAKYKSLEAPVLMFYEGSQLKLINYRVKDRFYVADRIMTKRAVLMAGQSRVVIERRKEPGKRSSPGASSLEASR